MDDPAYEHLLLGLQAQAERRPILFRAKVILISAAAYLLLFASLILLGLLLFWAFSTWQQRHSVMLLLALLGMAASIIPVQWIVIKMFLTRLPKPEGIEIHAKDAPKLFHVLSQLRRQLKGPAIDHVLITDDFNAAIYQRAKAGLFFGHRNYLMLGLPYLIGMAPKEMYATLAHEYGHIAGSHGKLGAWIYRQRRTFGALHEHTEANREDDTINRLFAHLLAQFAYYFNAYTFVLSREEEYQADAVATRLAGSLHNSHSLIRGDLLARWLREDFWPKLYSQAKTREKPAFMPYTAMPMAIKAARDEWSTLPRLRSAWAQNSDLLDTHPCLRDRVLAAGERCELPAQIKQSAADYFLGSQAAVLSKKMDEQWWQKEQKEWQQYYRQRSRALEKIAQFGQQALGSLAVGEAQEYAVLLHDYESAAAAKEVLEHLLQRSGEKYPKPMFLYGRILLDEGNRRGLDYLADAVRLAPAMFDEAGQLAYRWLYHNENESAAEEWIVQLGAALDNAAVEIDRQ
ncbi:M48 family metalloprotease [Chitinibacter bivalviorum]|uniref:M48 family metalloprotease n=1 Tax=Chitinibacter bivalviorum TaxID=2739434 RepID=A0A7H9BJI0_9NEIS|nr:M48 family metallopeptidase [Chitinibacter bivalviorum]QLG88466.1 M48 family metalloprotease [Chitinibacter bivalviorum]